MRILLPVLFVMLFATNSLAQALGYAEGGFAGFSGFFGRSSAAFHVGGGGEVVANDHIGFGGEIGFFDSYMTGSANVTLHLGDVLNTRFSPFVTGGYSRFGVGEGEFSAFNVGAGVHYWAADRVGFRMEFRDHFRPDDRGTTQYWSFRAGIAFR